MRNWILLLMVCFMAGSARANDDKAARKGHWDFRITSAAVVTYCINKFADKVSVEDSQLRVELEKRCGKQALELVDARKLTGFLTVKGEAVVHKVETAQAE